MDSETRGVQCKWDFNGDLVRLGAWFTETAETVKTNVILSSAQVPPQFLIGWVLLEYILPPPQRRSLGFLLGYLKYASLEIGQILELGFRWYLPFFVAGRSPDDTCFLAHTQFYPFPHSIVIYPSQFKFLISWTFPQHQYADTQASGQSFMPCLENGPQLSLSLSSPKSEVFK
jgi:hypothetical protein